MRKHLSITSTSGTLLGVDKYGEVLYGPVMYYERVEEVYKDIRGLSSIKMLNEKGVNVDSSSPIIKILYLKRVKPDVYNRVKWFVSPTTYILYRLLVREDDVWSEVYTDYTNALKFGLDITSFPPRWFELAYNELGLDIDKLPMLAPISEFIGVAKSRLAEEMGLAGAMLYQGLTDGNAAALAGGAIDIGDVNIYIQIVQQSQR